MSKLFSKTILHFDGDSFFASVEQVMDIRLRGKPVITGGERGAITSASIEAKRMGVNRGLSLRDAKKVCPGLIVVRGDYTSYSIFADRMYSIVREFTPHVEEYSIDECFADITRLDKLYKKSYEEIALLIKKKLETSLGLTFGVGMAPNKVLAKIASKHHKPAGFTVITKENRKEFLADLGIGKVWRIGRASVVDMGRRGLKTALDFAEKSSAWIDTENIAKPYQEIWLELQGHYIKELNYIPDAPKSIIKSRTFRPPSMDREFIFSQLSKNVEDACAKARRHYLKARHIRVYLKTQAFTYHSFDFSPTLAIATPGEILKQARINFKKMYQKNTLYRATGISLNGLVPEEGISHDLFGETEKKEKIDAVYEAVDKMENKYGQHTIFLGSSLKANGKEFAEETKKTLNIPFLGKVR